MRGDGEGHEEGMRVHLMSGHAARNRVDAEPDLKARGNGEGHGGGGRKDEAGMQ